MISITDYVSLAQAVYQTGILSDPWLDGRERFALNGVMLTPHLAHRLAQAAERVAFLHQELVNILLTYPELVTQFYQLTTCQQAMWEASGGLWHTMARADLFVSSTGRIYCCELNSDTPSGQPEAVLLNQLLQERHVDTFDPNTNFSPRFIAVLKESHSKRTSQPLQTVGIIYPTELTEDLAMIMLFRQWLEQAGIKVVLGSPYNLSATTQGVSVLGEPVDLIIRHYKTDWWGERLPVWTDALDYVDAEPLYTPLAALLQADIAGQVTICNPFGAVITQNKFSLAFFWEHHKLFSAQARRWIKQYLPETYRLTTMNYTQLRNEQNAWVLKSDYGCEGAETICGAYVSPEVWANALDMAIPAHFVVQKFFQAAQNVQGMIANYGVFLLGGTAAGYFTRLAATSTQYDALTVPTYIKNRIKL